MEYDLDRFFAAQQTFYKVALQEIQGGCKRTHWIWGIFPQIAGLGFSQMSRYMAIKDLGEAKAFIAEPTLRENLIEITEAAMNTGSHNASEIFGYPDDLKFRSCMTLFAIAAPEYPVFEKALEWFFNGEKDYKTVSLLKSK